MATPCKHNLSQEVHDHSAIAPIIGNSEVLPMNVLFASKKSKGVTFRVGKPVSRMDLGIQKLVGPAKDKLIMKVVACNNALATA